MKIFVPGFPVKEVNDPETSAARVAVGRPASADVAKAMELAKAREKQVLDYTRNSAKPAGLVVNQQPGDAPVALKEGGPTLEEWVAQGNGPAHYPPAGFAEVVSPLLTAFKTVRAKGPHSINQTPEVKA